jgi:cyclase
VLLVMPTMPTFCPTRRVFLHGLTATTCLAALPAGLALAADATLATTKLSDRLTLISGAGGNVVLFKGEQTLSLIDSGEASKTPALLALVNQLGGNLPIRTVFNTHWHDDHSGGNEALAAAGAQIIAHENTKLWLGADFDVEWRNTTHKPRPAAAFPTKTFYTDGSLDLGGEVVQYANPGQAHTDGDLYLYFPQSNVLVVGGLLANKKYPITDIASGGWIGGLINANKTLLGIGNDQTVIIPERGPAQTKANLKAQHDMLADLYEKLKELARQGNTPQAMLDSKVTAAYDALWGDPTEFIHETYRGMWAHTYDMGGFI